MSIDRALAIVDALMESPRTARELAQLCDVKYDTALEYLLVLRESGRIEFAGFDPAPAPGSRPSRWRWVFRAQLISTADAISKATGIPP